MILNPRGTSGSGKSTLVRCIVDEWYEGKTPHHVEHRKQPLYCTYERKGGGPRLHVLGHYETACGGCDTLPSYEATFELARNLCTQGDVLLEGLLLAADAARTIKFHEWLCEQNGSGGSLHVLYLTTPLEQCVANIQKRRTDRGDERPINPKNTESKFRGIKTTIKRLEAADITVHEGTFDQLLDLTGRMLA